MSTTTSRQGRPPGPSAKRWRGNAAAYNKDRLAFLTANAARYGDVFSYSSNTLVLSDPALIRDVFVRSNSDFHAEAPLFTNRADSAAMAAGTDAWMQSRRVGWRDMNQSMITKHGPTMVRALDDALSSASQHGDDVNVYHVMRSYTGEMITSFFFGPDAANIARAADERSQIAVRFMGSNVTLPKWLPHPRVRAAVGANQRLIAAVGDRVRRRRTEQRTDPQDLLDLLLCDRRAALSDDQIVRLLRVSLLASYGSPGAALCWVVQILATHPVVCAAIRDEVNCAGMDDPHRLTYTTAIVHETLRLYPPTWLMGREVARPCQLSHWRLGPGDSLMFSPYVVHRDPRWWDRPNEFRPSRWLDEQSPPPAATYFPFGAGPRVCLGTQLGTFQLVTATARLAFGYDIDVTRAASDQSPGALLLPDGLRARFSPRQGTSHPARSAPAGEQLSAGQAPGALLG